jgi:hypothetical protein
MWAKLHQRQFIQFLCCHLGLSAVSSAKPDNIFWNKFEETLFRWLIWTTFLQIFFHPHLSFQENGCRWHHLLKSGVKWMNWNQTFTVILLCTIVTIYEFPVQSFWPHCNWICSPGNNITLTQNVLNMFMKIGFLIIITCHLHVVIMWPPSACFSPISSQQPSYCSSIL